jgi:hypothetical protein
MDSGWGAKPLAWMMLSVVACGPKLVQGVPLAQQQAGEAAASASQEKAAEAAPILAPGKELVRWPQFDGAPDTVVLEGPRAWAVAPVPTGAGDCSYQAGMTISVENYQRVAGTQNVFKLDHWEGCEFASPGVLTMPLEKKAPKKGDFILAERDNGSQYGIVVNVQGDKTTYRAAKALVKATTDDVDCKTSEVLVMGKKAKLGMPAAMHVDRRYYLVTYLATDGRSTWVLTQGTPHAVKVEAPAIQVIDHTKPFKVGASVMAARTGDLTPTEHVLEPGKITKIIDDAIIEVQFDATKSRENVPIENVSAPIAG